MEQQEDDMKWIFEERKDYNKIIAGFARHKALNLKKISPIFLRCNPFSCWPSAAQDIYICSYNTSRMV